MKRVKIWGFVILAPIILGALTVSVILFKFSRELPSLEKVENYSPLLITTVYSEDNKVIAEYSTERRQTLAVGDLPKNISDAFIAAEDNEFMTHKGINPLTILRAAVKNFQAGQTVQGGSTITQQVAKSLLLTPERTMSRKIKEMLLAFKIEKALTKQQILHLYLNHIFLGNGAYGVEAAAKTYFGKTASELTIPEAAVLGGLPRAPSRDNPVANPVAARHRQAYVLGRLFANGMINRNQLEEYLRAPINIKNHRDHTEDPAPYFTEHVRRYLIQKYGNDKLYGEGLKVYTTLNLANQLAAQDAIKLNLQAVDKRQGLRRPMLTLKTIEARDEFFKKQLVDINEKFYDYKRWNPDGTIESPVSLSEPVPLEVGKNYQAVVLGKDAQMRILVQVANRKGAIGRDEYKWASEANSEEIYKEPVIRNPFNQYKLGDVITVQPKNLSPGSETFFLEQEPLVQGALLSYRIPDGAVQSLVGGYDFNVTRSEFNRAIQAVRQPGSTFKPFVYGAALEAGLTPSTIIVDSPIVYHDKSEQSEMEKVWRPDNFGERFYGDTTLRNALTYSRNIPTIKLVQYLKVHSVIEFARKLGITSNLNADLSLALGSSGLTLEELVRGIGVYANKGARLTPYFIKRVEDREGAILEEHQEPEPEQVISPATAYLMTSLLQSVVNNGTGTVVKPLGRPVAGKTGTTNDYKDALFVGYIPQLLTGVWVGFDEDRPIGRNETGGRAAAPIWLQYMNVATSSFEKLEFELPTGVKQVQIDADTGDIPTAKTKRRSVEYYAEGFVPGEPPMTKNEAGVLEAVPGAINHTAVITGNTGGPGSTESSPPDSESDINADELMRDDL